MDNGQHRAAEPGAHRTDAGGAVSATVCAADGWPVPEAVLTVIDGGGAQTARVQGDAEGSVVAPGLRPGAYTAIVTAVGYEPVARTTLVQEGSSAALGQIELRRAGGLELPTAGLWRIDPVHSSVQATARHLGISSVHGRFTDFSGQVRIAEQIEQSEVEAVIDASSVDTANRMRDDHLRAPDFLDVERYPRITFRSVGLHPRGEGRWDLEGDLTLCGQTRRVSLDTRFGGVGPDPWGGTRASATATTTLRRDEFDLNYNQALRTGIAAIGTTLKVEIDIQAVLAE
ncbi:YceI family protein [Salinifilum aidingensis]